MPKEFWKSKLFWTGFFMIMNAGIDAYLEGLDANAITAACFGMAVIVFRKFTSKGMAFALKVPVGNDIFSEVDAGDETPTNVKIVPNGEKSGPN
jgi:hypothetical protein